MASKTVSRSKSAAKAPAAVLREQKAKIAEAVKVPVPRMSDRVRHPASDAAESIGKARKKIGEIEVPMTLGEIANIIGNDVSVSAFAQTAFESIGDQIDTLAVLVETDASNDSWRLFKNLSERAKLAGRVAAWLEHDYPETLLPEVQP